jgi:hypothetical protein
MNKKLVDVFDRSGGKLFTYSIALEDVGCLDAEFEEVALIFAASSGLVTADQILHLRARCDRTAQHQEVAADVSAPASRKRSKSTVISLIKHRMKRAGMASQRHRVRHVS